MSEKTKKVLALIFTILPSLMVVMSGVMKLSGSEQVVTGLSKIGFGSLISVLGAVELISVALFLYPKTYKIGFYLLLSYLGGAAAIEISTGQNPVALALIALAWIGVFLKGQDNFLPATSK
ncbi:DoxX family protein [Emticicia sp. CRIBPO]|uniref:DoxX family protein n=1 Tax=Emticicia sp. CRIBPO TaxID=2683258 RepID=UPI0014129557|nr:DoxX family protein [Emticicia sp. CRIBPO]NBA89034.1 DoxX family protein [Emticicia sp. CRIBPO]